MKMNMLATGLAAALVALPLSLASPFAIHDSGYGLPTDASVITCAEGATCSLASRFWTECNDQTDVPVVTCLCSQDYYLEAMGPCLMCLEKSNPFVHDQFQNVLALQLCARTISVPQFQQQFYHLGISQNFPLLLPNATLTCWDEPHPLERRQIGDVLDDPEADSGHHDFVGDHLPVTREVSVNKRQNNGTFCGATDDCKTAAAIFDWCVNCAPDHTNNTVTWDCFCKNYNTMWKSSVSGCASCLEPDLGDTSGRDPAKLPLLIEEIMDNYCNFTTPDFSTNDLIVQGNQITADYESPLLFFNISIPTGPIGTKRH